MKFLALGDSYTIGESVSPGERWPAQLVHRLREQGVAVQPPEIIARTGWTTDELIAAIAQTALSPPYALVSLLIGVNNQYRGYSPQTYRREFRTLLQQAVSFADHQPSRVIVLSIPDWSVTPFAAGSDRERIRAEINTFNAINFQETQIQGANYLNVTDISRLAASDPGLIAEDGLHPSGKMYTLWVEEIFPLAVNILK